MFLLMDVTINGCYKWQNITNNNEKKKQKIKKIVVLRRNNININYFNEFYFAL